MTDRFSETLPFGTKNLLNGKYRTSLRDYTESLPERRARVQCQSVKKQYGGDLRRQKCKQWADYRRCRKGGLWRIPTASQGKISCTGGLPGGHGEKGINKSRRKPI